MAGVVDAGVILIVSVNDTNEQLIAGVNDTGEQLIAGFNHFCCYIIYDRFQRHPANNLWPVAINVNLGQKCDSHRR
jgi:hypothetical protein